MVRPTIAVLAIALTAAVAACSGHRRVQPGGGVPAERFGVYRAKLTESGESPRKAKVLLFAALPDRLHAEVLPPIGGPALILDGGDGRLAVTVGSREAAWVGEAGEDVLESILGFPVTLDALVRSLLQGAALEGPVQISRAPESGSGLPRSFSMVLPGRELRLELQRTRERGRGAYAIGTGTPPPGVEVHALEELVAEGGPFLFSEE